jgi:hypothetical protein
VGNTFQHARYFPFFMQIFSLSIFYASRPKPNIQSHAIDSASHPMLTCISRTEGLGTRPPLQVSSENKSYREALTLVNLVICCKTRISSEVDLHLTIPGLLSSCMTLYPDLMIGWFRARLVDCFVCPLQDPLYLIPLLGEREPSFPHNQSHKSRVYDTAQRLK